MKKLNFFKLQASGNDFILVKDEDLRGLGLSYKKFALKYCRRKLGVGADGLLVVSSSKIANIKMRIFNPDGSEAEMCGNGARCTALYTLIINKKSFDTIKLETGAGIVEASMRRLSNSSAKVKIKMGDPFDLRLDLPLKILGKTLKVNYINTGVPHVVIFVESIEDIDVTTIGKMIRFHKKFSPAGTNVDFVEIVDDDHIKVRTYERGVEDETWACGTGIVASSIISGLKLRNTDSLFKIKAQTKIGDIVKVYFRKKDNLIDDVWLEGKAYLVYQGCLEIK